MSSIEYKAFLGLKLLLKFYRGGGWRTIKKLAIWFDYTDSYMRRYVKAMMLVGLVEERMLVWRSEKNGYQSKKVYHRVY